jgi:hypothetical protein
MGNFTATIIDEFTFDGDKIVTELRRLKRKHVGKLSPFFTEVENNGTVKLSFKDQISLQAELETILPECIVKIEGLKDKSGNALKLSEIIEDFYFMPLFQHWMGVLMSQSFLRSTEEKKSDPQQPAVASGATAVVT